MACMGCGSTTPKPKPQLAASTIRPTGNVVTNGGKLTFGKPRIVRGK